MEQMISGLNLIGKCVPVSACMRACLRVCACVCVCVCKHACMHVCVHACGRACLCVCLIKLYEQIFSPVLDLVCLVTGKAYHLFWGFWQGLCGLYCCAKLSVYCCCSISSLQKNLCI